MVDGCTPAPIPQTAAATTSEEPTTSSEIRAGPTSEKNAQVSSTSTSYAPSPFRHYLNPCQYQSSVLHCVKHVSASLLSMMSSSWNSERSIDSCYKSTQRRPHRSNQLRRLSTTAPDRHTGLFGGRYVTSTPAPPPRHVVTSMSPLPPYSGSRTVEARLPDQFTSTRMIKETSKKPTWTNPFDSKWLEKLAQDSLKNVTERKGRFRRRRRVWKKLRLVNNTTIL